MVSRTRDGSRDHRQHECIYESWKFACHVFLDCFLWNLPAFVLGDVKPGNFCLKAQSLDTRDPLKAIDFGCSQSLSPQGKRLSKRAGTPAFMSPEIFAKDYAEKADIW